MSDENGRNPMDEVSRRTFLRLGAIAGAGAPLAGVLGGSEAGAQTRPPLSEGALELEEATIAEMQDRMTNGGLTAKDLVDRYLERIRTLDQDGPCVNSILEVNPDAKRIARGLDRERRDGEPRGPLHGIPIVLKGNIDTADQMTTTAGSLALLGDPPHQDATVAARLRAAGAVILGKTNLSEWANFRGFSSSSGWSGQGGQTRNPYVLDRNPCGSSSGSAAAVSANFAAGALGTETDGSIVCPASTVGVVGIKPTVGLTSRAGVIPISHTQDTVGPHARTVADAVTILSALVGVDPRDPATAASAGRFSTDYRQFLDAGALQGARIGVMRGGGFTGYSNETDELYEEALQVLEEAGAVLVDAEIPTIDELNADDAEIIVLVYEFKRDLNAYLATRTGVPVQDMADVIAFNLAHANRELRYFGQEWFELAEAEIFTEQEYMEALERGHRLAGPEGIDAAIAEHDLDALVAPTGSPAWPTDLINGDHFLGASSGPAAVAGYPNISVPMGFTFGLPVGLSFMAGAWTEGKLIGLTHSFEQAAKVRRAPQFEPTIPLPKPKPSDRKAAEAAAVRLQKLVDRLKANPKVSKSLLRLI